MKMIKPVETIVNQVKDFFLDDADDFSREDPFRSELLSIAQLEQHAQQLARWHQVEKGIETDKVLKRLEDNENVLGRVHEILVEAVAKKQPVTPASEWFLDNYYLLQEQIKLGRKHLPKGYSETLPVLTTSRSAGFPRVYDIALQVITHNDGRIDLDNVSAYIQAYQEITKLTLGELWAIPIMLRMALIENVRRIASSIAIDYIDKNAAHHWSSQILETAQQRPRNIIVVLAEMTKADIPFNSAFVSEFTRRLQGRGQGMAMPLALLDQNLAETGYTAEELINIDNQKQAADQVSIRNSIESLRLVKTTDWHDFIEAVSDVEQILRQDPGGIYSAMDFVTRDRYRHVIEKLSRKSKKPEYELAQLAIDMTRQNLLQQKPERECHVGYFLIDDTGRRQLAARAALRYSFTDRAKDVIKNNVLFFFSAAIIIPTLFVSLAFVHWLYVSGAAAWWCLIIFLLSFTGFSQVFTMLVNWLSSVIVLPQQLPKMDYEEGIPVQYSTAVVVPCMFTSGPGIDTLVTELEIRYLANPEDNLYFVLLSDFSDANAPVMPKDAELLEYAEHRITELNEKYSPQLAGKFFLFHRNRKWNPGENRWMGKERKRGKLAEFNSFVLNTADHDFARIVGNAEVLRQVKYVITLDADTLLPRETAWKMVAAMAHPLNHPVVDPEKNIVVHGYGILQPRVAVNMPVGNSSGYTRMHANDAGIDPYTQLTSDVYQDLFRQGSFIGKGIYDIKAFERVLANRFPDNRILSHDLLEGCYAGSGLLTDVQLFEDYPGKYREDVTRKQRWIRGDWQIASWMLPFVPDRNKKLKPNPVSVLSRLKIWDNIRRSLVPIAFLLLLCVSWLLLPKPGLWTAVILSTWLIPSLVAAVWNLFHKAKDLDLRSHLTEIRTGMLNNMGQAIFNIACLPFEAYQNSCSIMRSNWRMLVSKKHLLEWTPSAALKPGNEKSLWSMYRYMLMSVWTVLVVVSLLLYFNPFSIIIAAPVLVLWLLAPAAAYRLSRPVRQQEYQLSDRNKTLLYGTSRKIWAFFEDFVTADDNWLPPDNYQEQPVAVTAHRTSPTNIGLALLSDLAAFDFGYISLSQVITRIDNTFGTLNKLQRYKGHLYNWYDTQNLTILPPAYISMVDSGNFISSIITLKQGLLELRHAPVVNQHFYKGLQDTLLASRPKGSKSIPAGEKSIETVLEQLLKQPLSTPGAHYEAIAALHQQLQSLINQLPNVPEEKLYWLGKAERQLQHRLQDLVLLTPWAAVDINNYPEAIFSILNKMPGLSEIQELPEQLASGIKHIPAEETLKFPVAMMQGVTHAAQQARDILNKLDRIINYCDALANVSYGFLYDKDKNLFHIGYNVNDDIPDKNYYDLLASEARLGVFTAIAQGKIPQNSWFALGRLITDSGGDAVLLSWSGSMFEYLMPQLIMPVYENTLLAQTLKAALQNQIAYGEKRRVPWGISESGYNLVDSNLNYQYQAFGVPGMGLKRGLSEDLVIAPYAAVMALMVDPAAACQNLELMLKNNFDGKYGFYEAVDYTPLRLPRGETRVIIRSFMAHHQAMAFLSLASLLLNKKMQERFERDPQFQSTLMLLQERIPRTTGFYTYNEDPLDKKVTGHHPNMRIIRTPHTPIPEVQLLSNGKYHVAITNTGGGYTHWKGLSLTRWREDITKDCWGIFCYIKDVATGVIWSNTYQPTLVKPKSYEAIFSQGHVEFKREDEGFETKTDMVVSPEDDVEIRRIKITNKGSTAKVVEITSYCEIVLAAQAADEAHPAFSNLFVQTQILERQKAIVCTRRARSRDEQPPWMFHQLLLRGGLYEGVSFETDRLRFIGRTKNTGSPVSVVQGGALSGTQGPVLDPVAAIRYRVAIKPKQTITLDLMTGAADSKELCEALVNRYEDEYLKNRAFELSWTHSQVLLRQINASEDEAQLFGSMAGSIIYANAAHRAASDIIISNFKGQSGLWGYAISGDLPIVLLRVHNSDNIEYAKQLIKAHSYWRMKGLVADLVIWNEDYGSYRQMFHDQILGIITGTSGTAMDQSGGVFVRAGDQVSNEDRVLFLTAARLVLSDEEGTLEEQIARLRNLKTLPPLLKTTQVKYVQQAGTIAALPAGLLFNNGTGGFTQDGKEYIVLVSRNKTSPAPWSNVMANPSFGSLVTESGSAYTWCDNAQAYRLTPWENDPVSDRSGEAFYLRDDESGRYWSLTLLPAPDNGNYLVRHGFGYTVFEHINEDIRTEMWQYVAVEAPVKFIVLNIKNLSGRERKLSVTGYIEWILGDVASKNRMHIITEKDMETGVIFIRNKYNSVFTDKVSFFDTDAYDKSFTCDRTEFIGRNGNLETPEALQREKLSGRSGAGFDPCTALMVPLLLQAGEEQQVVFRLGSARDEHEARRMAAAFRGVQAAHAEQSKLHDHWNAILNVVQVQTPDPAFNVMVNGWWVYQVLAARLWGRTGFYQSGGAFGFRDQLQDVLALMHTRPDLSRQQILLAASRQFREGDVQHWWHPPSGRGVRTTCSDDYLWLPYVTARYIQATGDRPILDEYVSFIEGRPLRPDEDAYYDLPVFLNHWESLYNHCKYAIEYGLKFGVHGLPLMGSGDWNDGMDKVGIHGKGESVWLAFFLYDVLEQFSTLAQNYGDRDFAMLCTAEAEKLKANINKNGWDGQWYRRAYFDDGTPLGSKENEECRIDAVSQSWSVLSGAGTPDRCKEAMEAVNQYLIDRGNGIIKLLDPPFDTSNLYPGYIKGYVPGVRENGGQYTHAAIWAIMAFASMKQNERVWELFSMVNPVNHSLDVDAVQHYKAEPYVMAADVYGAPPHLGRGGWTWYTGSAGWTYQLALEWILGIKRRDNRLFMQPCIPGHWEGFEVYYRFGNTTWHITVVNSKKDGTVSVQENGQVLQEGYISLADDGQQHEVRVTL